MLFYVYIICSVSLVWFIFLIVLKTCYNPNLPWDVYAWDKMRTRLHDKLIGCFSKIIGLYVVLWVKAIDIEEIDGSKATAWIFEEQE